MQNQRSPGLSLGYKWQRFNMGTDMLFTKDKHSDAAIGVNFVPFNNALLSAGFAVKTNELFPCLQDKEFQNRLHQRYRLDSKRTGKPAICNGEIYGEFIFDRN